jgi:hypothetical protein
LCRHIGWRRPAVLHIEIPDHSLQIFSRSWPIALIAALMWAAMLSLDLARGFQNVSPDPDQQDWLTGPAVPARRGVVG